MKRDFFETKVKDKSLVSTDKKPRKQYRKRRPGELRGKPLSGKSKQEIERVQSLWNLHPDSTQIQLAYLSGVGLDRLAKWIQRGHLERPAAKVVEEQKQKEERVEKLKRKAVRADARPDTPIDDEWDCGPIPTIESIRREIKRRIQSAIVDPDTVSKYAQALKSLDSVREKEDQQSDEEAERMLLMLPMESQAPVDPADTDE